MSAVARAFLRRRNWLDNLDGQPLRDLTVFEQRISDALRDEAAYPIGFMAS